MKIVVGLGNIGQKYKQTRHNIGFLAVDFLAEKLGNSSWKEEKKFFGTVCAGTWKNEKILFLKPNTFMNLSGKSVAAGASFYKIARPEIFVIFDDIDLPFAKIRVRKKGGSGGHNGIKSLISNLGGDDFVRIKVGISNEFRAKKDTADFVLGKFLSSEKDQFSQIFNDIESVFLSKDL